MIRLSNMRLPVGYDDADIRRIAARELRVSEECINKTALYRRSIDARKKNDIHYVTSIDVYLNTDEHTALSRSKSKNARIADEYTYEQIIPKNTDKRVLIVGAGPAGLFAALILSQSGVRPILIDRGGDVDSRTKKIDSFWKSGDLDEECNVQFGEGGAGTFSDGKLNTGTKDSRARKVLAEFVHNGAPEDILCNAKPHIGTDKLRETVKNLRREIIALGGEVRFNTRLTDIRTRDGAVCGAEIVCNGKRGSIECDSLVLAIGHSARDTFEMLYDMGLMIEPKPFSVGVRVEHLRERIDRSQYGDMHRRLPAAYYKESVHLKDGRGVYTFCMCPGGLVVAGASEKGGVVTNGMSEYARDKINSNAALLVSVAPDDIKSDHILKGMYFQRELEQKAYAIGGEDYRAPVQRVGDFLDRQETICLGEVKPSYLPGVSFAQMDAILPGFVCESMRAALPMIDRRLKGFSHPDAVLTAVESRSSSPIRILRDESMQSVSLRGLYPCGEGAGYAGGIISAAVDGIKVAEKIMLT